MGSREALAPSGLFHQQQSKGLSQALFRLCSRKGPNLERWLPTGWAASPMAGPSPCQTMSCVVLKVGNRVSGPEQGLQPAVLGGGESLSCHF